jgi:hypothetical protein
MNSTESKSFFYSPYFIGFVVLVFIMMLYYNGFFATKKSGTEKVKPRKEMDEHNTADGDADKFIASGGRSDSHGEDMGLIDRIHAINKAQQDYVNKSKPTYRYDAREDAAPAIYSPEEQLQNDLYQN